MPGQKVAAAEKARQAERERKAAALQQLQEAENKSKEAERKPEAMPEEVEEKPAPRLHVLI